MIMLVIMIIIIIKVTIMRDNTIDNKNKNNKLDDSYYA